MIRSLSVDTPNHWAIPFQRDSHGLVGINIPGSKAKSPSFVKLVGKSPKILPPFNAPEAMK